MAEDKKACPFCGEVATRPDEKKVLFLKKEITRLTAKIDELIARGVPPKAIAVLEAQRDKHTSALDALITEKTAGA